MRNISAWAVATGLLLSGCQRPVAVGYRITVTVDDNGVKHSGTGVWRSTIRAGGFPNGYTTRFQVEAIPIELGAKGTIYVLIVGRDERGHPTSYASVEIYGRHLFGEVMRLQKGLPIKHLNPLQQYQELAGMVGHSAILDCANPPTKYTSCPFFVRFRDERDPTTVEAVDPNDLAATFGKGVRLEPIKVTVTDKPPTSGIGNYLKWLGDHPEPRLDTKFRGSANPNLSQELAFGAFRRE